MPTTLRTSSLAAILVTALGLPVGLGLGACSDPAPAELPGPDAGTIPDPEPAALELLPAALGLPVVQGRTATLDLVVRRDARVVGAVTITASGLPAGVTADPLTLAEGVLTGALTLRATATAPHSLPTAVTLRATAGADAAMATVDVTVAGPAGAVDTSFGGGKVTLPVGISDDVAAAVAVQADGKLVVAGTAAEHRGDFALVRLDRDGRLDPTFGAGGKVLTDLAGAADTVHALAIQADGKIVVAGTTTTAATGNDFAVARYLPDGRLDPAFGQGGVVITALGADADTAYAIALQPDGAIVVGGDSSRGASQSGLDFALVRYTAAGALDASFGQGGVVLTPIAANGGRDSIYALGLQTIDGEDRIVAAGGEGDFAVARYRPSGALDGSFGAGGKVSGLFGSTIGAARALAIGPLGAITVAGHAQHDVALVRLTAAGALDAGFGAGGKVVTRVSATNWDEAQAVQLDLGGAVLVGGWVFAGGGSAGDFAVLRYLPNGQLDPAFAGTGVVVTPVAAGAKADQAMALAIQPDGRVPTRRVIAAGWASDSNSDFAVTRIWQ